MVYCLYFWEQKRKFAVNKAGKAADNALLRYYNTKNGAVFLLHFSLSRNPCFASSKTGDCCVLREAEEHMCQTFRNLEMQKQARRAVSELEEINKKLKDLED